MSILSDLLEQKIRDPNQVLDFSNTPDANNPEYQILQILANNQQYTAPESTAEPTRTKADFPGSNYWTTNPIQQIYNLTEYPLGSRPGEEKSKLESPAMYDIKPTDKWSTEAVRLREKNKFSGWTFKHAKTGKTLPIEKMSDTNTKFGGTFTKIYSPEGKEESIRNPYTSGAVTDFPLLPAKSLLGALGLNMYETIPWAMMESGHPGAAIATGLYPWAVPKAINTAINLPGKAIRTGAKAVSNLSYMHGYDVPGLLGEVKQAIRSDPKNALRAIYHDYPYNQMLVNEAHKLGGDVVTAAVNRGGDFPAKPFTTMQSGYFRQRFGLPRYPNVPTDDALKSYNPKWSSNKPDWYNQDYWNRVERGYENLERANPMYSMKYKGIEEYPHAFWKNVPIGLRADAKKWLEEPYNIGDSYKGDEVFNPLGSEFTYRGSGLKNAPDYHDVLGFWGPFGNYTLTKLPKTGKSYVPKGTGVHNVGYEDISEVALKGPKERKQLETGLKELRQAISDKLLGRKKDSWEKIWKEYGFQRSMTDEPAYGGGNKLGSLLGRWAMGKAAVNPPIRNFGEFEVFTPPGTMKHPLKRFDELKSYGSDPSKMLVPRFVGHVIPPSYFYGRPWSKGYLESFRKGRQNEYQLEGLLKHWSGIKGPLTTETGALSKKGEKVYKALFESPERTEKWDKIVKKHMKSGKPLEELKAKRKDFNTRESYISGGSPGFMRQTYKDYKDKRFGVYRLGEATLKEADWWGNVRKAWDKTLGGQYSGVRRFGQRRWEQSNAPSPKSMSIHGGEFGIHEVPQRLTRSELVSSVDDLSNKVDKLYSKGKISRTELDATKKRFEELWSRTLTRGELEVYHEGRVPSFSISGEDPVKALSKMEAIIESLK